LTPVADAVVGAVPSGSPGNGGEGHGSAAVLPPEAADEQLSALPELSWVSEAPEFDDPVVLPLDVALEW
jgi:hypothetical protein